ncbi:hypothetical protein FO519_007227 [Halicephalobus sp. NKZ332]|nr:hypothetical protein FO519_007227 [Halicephalobus sp. NKZ332]
MTTIVGKVIFFLLITLSALLQIATIILPVWDSDLIWNQDSYTYNTNYYVIGGVMVIINLFVHALILLNTLLTIPRDRPVQTSVAMFRSSAMALYPVGETIACIINVSVHSDTNSSTGFVLLGGSVVILVFAAIVGFITAHHMKKKVCPHWDQSTSGCVFFVPY